MNSILDSVPAPDAAKSSAVAHPPRFTYVLYHANCMDGFGSAYAACLSLGWAGVFFQPVVHGEAMPTIPDGSIVYILDFSYPRATLEALARRTILTVIDHHKTAAADLDGLPFAHFDMEKSGAVLTWEYFQSTGHLIGPVPPLLQYVQDRDLWRWELPHSREVSAALPLQERSFKRWAELDTEDGIDSLALEGRTAIKAQQALVDLVCHCPRRMQFGAFLVPVVNTSVLISECCERLMQMFPAAPFVASYYDQPGTSPGSKRIWSLRTNKNGFDVSAIAKKHGGGGHAKAAGFTKDQMATSVE